MTLSAIIRFKLATASSHTQTQLTNLHAPLFSTSRLRNELFLYLHIHHPRIPNTTPLAKQRPAQAPAQSRSGYLHRRLFIPLRTYPNTHQASGLLRLHARPKRRLPVAPFHPSSPQVDLRFPTTTNHLHSLHTRQSLPIQYLFRSYAPGRLSTVSYHHRAHLRAIRHRMRCLHHATRLRSGSTLLIWFPARNGSCDALVRAVSFTGVTRPVAKFEGYDLRRLNPEKLMRDEKRRPDSKGTDSTRREREKWGWEDV